MSSVVREIESRPAAPLRPVRLGKFDAVLERRADGAINIRAAQKLGRFDDTLAQPLEHWAKAAPDRMFLAQRDAQGQWRRLSYAEVLGNVRRIAAALLRRGLSPEKPIVILSGNDIEHALLALAAMYVGRAKAHGTIWVLQWAASSVGRAPRSQRGGREFEPPAVHQNRSAQSPAEGWPESDITVKSSIPLAIVRPSAYAVERAGDTA